MSPSTGSDSNENGTHHASDPNPPTLAAFSPVTLSNTSSSGKHRSTILVHQKSPLLIATPPQITRALAYSHPFLLPLNKIAGLLTWTSGDPWESFLLVASFWAVVLYGDVVIRWAGPIILVAFLILGMYSRRYSPLSSTTVNDDGNKKGGHKRGDSEATHTTHQKTLDEIVETLRVFTSRCNVLLDPLLQLTDFLSTQRTATTATTRPALTALFLRILLVTPLWIVLTLPFFHVITTKRVVLVVGTLMMTWHSRPNRVSREVLWRSSLIRKVSATITGLDFTQSGTSLGPDGKPPLPSRKQSLAATMALRKKSISPGVRFTFILYENQRRWIGLGWTQSLFSYERAAWTDEHLNPAPSKEEFELPEVEGGEAKWRWVEGSRWLVEGAGEYDEGGIKAKADADGGQGWVYFDNKWEHGRRGQDSWGRYTRRRKWYRDAELVEVTGTTPIETPKATPRSSNSTLNSNSSTPTQSELEREPPPEYTETILDERHSSRTSTGFRKGSVRRRGTSGGSSFDDDGDDGSVDSRQNEGALRGISDDARMGLE